MKIGLVFIIAEHIIDLSPAFRVKMTEKCNLIGIDSHPWLYLASKVIE